MNSLWQDLRYGVRTLRKSPGFTLVAVLTLALGIGPNMAIFSIVDALLLRPLPGIEASAPLVTLGRTENNTGFDAFAYPDYIDFRDQNSVFAGLAAYHLTPLHLSTGNEVERVAGATVSGNYFEALGARAARGRVLAVEDDRRPGAHPVAVISYGLWQRRLGSDPGVVGRDIKLNEHTFTVVGITNEKFAGTKVGEAIDVWVPLAMQSQAKPTSGMLSKLDVFGNRSFSWLSVFGRLKPNVSVNEAQAHMSTLASGLTAAYPDSHKGTGVAITDGIGLDPETRTSWAGFMKMLMAVVGLVLLIACANVANLLLARGTARHRELGIRLALGASRRRLAQQLITESLLLSVAGGLCGLVLMFWTAGLLPTLFAPTTSFVRTLDLQPDLRLLVFTLTVSLVIGIAFGLIHAWQVSSTDLVPVIKEASLTKSGTHRSQIRQVLLILQVAVSLMLLIGAGLFVRTLWNMRAIKPGFDTDTVAVTSLDLSLQGYGEAKGRLFYRQLIERVEKLPGVESSSLARVMPLGGGLGMLISVEKFNSTIGESRIQAIYNIITPRHFHTLNIPLVRGRDFTEQDTADSRHVTIINETAARQLFAGEDPLGKRLLMPLAMGKTEAVEIVGVAKDVKHRSLLEQTPIYMYLPAQQRYEPVITLHVRASSNAASIITAVRSEVQQLDKSLPVYEVMTISERLRESLWRQRSAATLVGLCGIVALALASIGLYGVLSYSVARRTHEIGIRMALGAPPTKVRAMIVRQGIRLTIIGILFGLVAAFTLTQLIASQLYGVTTTDPVTILSAVLMLMLVALVASYIPAQRATKVDPVVALRHE